MRNGWLVLIACLLVGVTGALGGSLAADRKAAEPKFEDAVKLLGQEKFADAEKVLDRILARSPTAMNARLLMGWTLWSQGRYDEALSRFKSVLHDAPAQRFPTPEEIVSFNIPSDVAYIDNPDLVQARKGLGWTYFKKGWIRLAADQFELLNQKFSDWDEPYLGLGYAYLAQGKFKEAETAFSAYLQRTGSGTRKPHEGHRGLGDLYAAQGQHAKAVPHFEKALAAKAGWVEVQSALAWSSFRAEQTANADRLFTQLKKFRPIEAETGLAWIALKRDHLDEAEEGFSRALAARPGYGLALDGSRELRLRRYKAFDEAWALYNALKYPEAAAAFEALLKNSGRLPTKMKPFVLNGLAWSRLRLNEVDDAEKLFQASLRELPKGAEATAGIGWVAIKRREWDSTEMALKEADSLLPGLSAVADGLAAVRAARFERYDRAWRLYDQGNYGDAVKAFEVILGKPDALPAGFMPFVWGGVGWSELALGQLERAERAFAQIRVGTKAEEAESKAGLGWIALKRNQPGQARKLFTEALAAVPGFSAALRGLAELRKVLAPELDEAWSAYYQGKFSDASSAFKKVADNASLPAEYRREAGRGYAWSLYRADKLQEASAEFDRLLNGRDDADLLYGQGLALLRLDKREAAVPALKRAADLAPYALDYRLTHGWAALRGGDAKEALASFTRAYQLAPTSVEVNRSLGWAYAKASRAAEAKAAFRYALRLSPGGADDKELRALIGTKEYRDLRSDLAWGYVRWQAFDAARKLFEEIVKDDPADGDAWFGHGYTLYKLGKGPEAEKSLDRAIRAKRSAAARTVWVVFPGAGAHPISTDPRSILGWVALVGGNCDKAVERFEVSLNRDPDMVASLVGKGICLAKGGSIAQAREVYLTAQEIYPSYPAVLAGLRETEPKQKAEAR